MTIQTLLQPIINVFLTVGFLAMIVMIVLGIVVLVLWVLTLIYQFKRKQYIWFVLSIFISPLWLIYWIVWLCYPELKKKK